MKPQMLNNKTHYDLNSFSKDAETSLPAGEAGSA
jgi:hypothetical protein